MVSITFSREDHMSTTSEDQSSRNTPTLVIALCFVAIVFDGFDLVVYGTVVPDLLAHPDWNLTPVEAGRIGSYALVGMLIGALSIGYLTDVVGRRRVMIASVVFFSAMMLATAVAPSPELFGLFRFLGGLGLGGVIPTAIALTVEYSPLERRNFNNAVMFCGYAVGGVLAATSALVLLEHIGFRGMMALGGLPLLTVVPLLVRLLPESPSYLVSRGRADEARDLRERFGLQPPPAPQPAGSVSGGAPDQQDQSARPLEGLTRLSGLVSTVLRGRWLVATTLFCLAGIAGQTLVYGLNTWMPQLMVLAGYSLSSSLSFLLTVNAGAVVGVLVSSSLADHYGPRLITAGAFTASAAALLLMGTGAAPLPLMYVLVAVVGFGSVGAQILVNGFVATYYPTASRATALGLMLGLGRLGAILAINAGGWLVAAELSDLANFGVWSVAALVGICAVLAVPSAPVVERKALRGDGVEVTEVPTRAHVGETRAGQDSAMAESTTRSVS
jgi:AAHS family benzoate transporter-like MFS transporter